MADSAQAHTDAASGESSILGAADGAGVKPETGADSKGGESSILGGAGEDAKPDGKPEDKGNEDQGGDKDKAKAEGEEKDKDGEGKPKDGEDKPKGAPEAYEPFTMPEGLELDSAAVDLVAPVLKELDLPQESAQKLVDAYVKLQAQQAQAAEEALAEQRKTWAGEFRKTKGWQEEAGYARRALDTFGDDASKQMFADSWLGDHPAVLSFLARIGKSVSEDRGPGAGKGPTGTVVDRAASFYPSMARKGG